MRTQSRWNESKKRGRHTKQKAISEQEEYLGIFRLKMRTDETDASLPNDDQ